VLETPRAHESCTVAQATHLSSNGSWLPGQSRESLLPLISSLALFSPGPLRPSLAMVSLRPWEADGAVVARPAWESCHAFLTFRSRLPGYSWQSGPSRWSVDHQQVVRACVESTWLALNIIIYSLFYQSYQRDTNAMMKNNKNTINAQYSKT